MSGGLIRLECRGSIGRCNGWLKLATVDPSGPRGALGARARFNLARGESVTLRVRLPLQTLARLRTVAQTQVRLRTRVNDADASSLLTLHR